MNNSTTADTPIYLPIREAAERLSVHPETLRRWDRKGIITARRLPNGYRRFLSTDLDALYAAGPAA